RVVAGEPPAQRMQAVVVAPQEVFEGLAVAAACGADQRRVVAVVGNVDERTDAAQAETRTSLICATRASPRSVIQISTAAPRVSFRSKVVSPSMPDFTSTGRPQPPSVGWKASATYTSAA